MKRPWIKNVKLEGDNVSLRLLSPEDEYALIEAATDGKLWELSSTSVPEPEHTKAYIEKALDDFKKGMAYPFVVVHNATNKIIGSTRYVHIDATNKRLEIGFTWYSKSHQRTGINRECKLLLLSFAFEQLQCIAVEFRTHHLNIASRTAIERLGAKCDGILRNHRIDRIGGIRHTVVYSITNEEWAQVKEDLERGIEKYRGQLH